jgi:hypothetical protein
MKKIEPGTFFAKKIEPGTFFVHGLMREGWESSLCLGYKAPPRCGKQMS